MHFIPVKTKVLPPPKSNLYKVLEDSLPTLHENDVVFITSKVLAIHQGRCVPMATTTKEVLIQQEADSVLPGSRLEERCMILTVTKHILIPNAGIDESKSSGYYILWPNEIEQTLKRIWVWLRTKHKVKNIAVVATDTHTSPLRLGVTGVAIGLFGMEPLNCYKDRLDVFGNPIQTRVNIVDPLAAMAVLFMGEGDEQTPVLIARNVPGIEFVTKPTYNKLVVPLDKDIYAPLFDGFNDLKSLNM